MSKRWQRRIRDAWMCLRGQSYAHWTPDQIDQINYEMAEGTIDEIGDVLRANGCCCDAHAMDATPPMFYPEAIVCALKAAYKRGLAEGRRGCNVAREEV